ncbi:MAG: hypothetical protein RBS57_16455, partial [Desulforhabdus sp.]|nr:hypothetical protein [Desulforhabdus sp.]
FESSFFAAVSRNTIPSQTSDALINVLVALATLVREFSATRGKVRAGRGRNARYPTYPNAPIPKPLKREWMQLECFDYPCEFRLARAVGAMVPWGRLPNESQSNPVVDGIRINLLPLKRGGGEWHWQENSRSAVWARGATLFDNLAAVLRRRLIDAQKAKGAGLPLWSCYGASFSDLLALWQGEVDQQRLTELVFGLSLVDSGIWKNESIDEWQQKHDPTPDLQASAVWFDRNDEPRISLRSLIWHGRPLLAKTDEQAEEELISAFQLPRVYALLKLCFLGGRLPARSMEGQTIRRTRREPYPPPALDVLSLLQAGRLPEAVEVAARKLRARGYPPMINNPKFSSSDLAMPQDECRRLAGLLLIPVRHAGVLAALAIKPCPKTN